MKEFAGVQVTERIRAAFVEDGIEEPTPIQRAAIGEILAGRHVVLASGTGTGKTLAYLLPVLERLSAKTEERAVVVAPSAELASQVVGVARRYKEPEVSVVSVVAGGSQRRAKERLQKSTRLIIGSPGRILELVERRKLKGMNLLVLDEPDPILVDDRPRLLRELLSRPEPKVQLVIAGATLGPKTESFISDVIGQEAVWLRNEQQDPLRDNIDHRFVRVQAQAREVSLARFIERERCQRAIVFSSQPQHIRHLYRYLSERGHKPVTLSDERSKHERRLALHAFDTSKANVLVTTDAAARGIDLHGVAWVLHYDLPSSAPAYVHRAGRTGRAGQRGTSVCFVSDKESPILWRLMGQLRIDCPLYAAR